ERRASGKLPERSAVRLRKPNASSSDTTSPGRTPPMRFRKRHTSRFLSLEFLEQRLMLSQADSYGNAFEQICECCQPHANNTAPRGATAPGQDLSPSANAMASDAGMGTGEFFQNHQIVGYMSQGVDRGLDLQYSSLQADPRPILQLALTTQAGSNSAGV